jgi:hypothetical protein
MKKSGQPRPNTQRKRAEQDIQRTAYQGRKDRTGQENQDRSTAMTVLPRQYRTTTADKTRIEQPNRTVGTE